MKKIFNKLIFPLLLSYSLTQSQNNEQEMKVNNIAQDKFEKQIILETHLSEKVYLYIKDEQKSIDITQTSNDSIAHINMNVLDSIIDTKKEFHMYHNHNNNGISKTDLENEGLYWITPSVLDMNQYIYIGKLTNNFTYTIVNKFGFLTISTDVKSINYTQHYLNGLNSDSSNIQHTLKKYNKDSLDKWAENYRGIFSLNFRYK